MANGVLGKHFKKEVDQPRRGDAKPLHRSASVAIRRLANHAQRGLTCCPCLRPSRTGHRRLEV